MFDDPMFDDLEEAPADRALQAGLRDLPTPEIAADFDTCILAALVRRPPWWQTVWLTLRPALPAAACALAVMLSLLHLAQQTPIIALSPRFSDIARDMAQRVPGARAQGGTPQESSLESMENIDLNSASLSFFSHPIRRTPGKRG